MICELQQLGPNTNDDDPTTRCDVWNHPGWDTLLVLHPEQDLSDFIQESEQGEIEHVGFLNLTERELQAIQAT